MPTISVIVPVYKVEPYLHRCVDSILAQTFTDFELILVDDGSPDNCGAICDEYAAKDNRIHVIHQQNGGLSAARNAGIDWAFANSDSQWLSFIDSDDWVHPCFLEYLSRAVKDTGTKISACHIQRTTELSCVAELSYHLEQTDWQEFYCRSWDNGVVAVNKLYAKELFSELRYPVGRIHEDEFLTYRLLEKASTIACVDVVLYYYFQNPSSITKRDFSLKTLDGVLALKEQCLFAKRNGYKRFYLDRMNGRMRILAKNYKLCRESNLNDPDKKRTLSFLKKELRTVLLQAGTSIAPFKQAQWIYEIAFPKLSWIYRKCRGIHYRIKRMVHHNANN